MTTGFLLPAAPPETDRKQTASASEAYREMILLELSRGRNAMGIWQDLVDRHGFAGSYQSVKRFVRTLNGSTSLEARVIIETVPGEECQVDYGTGPMVRDPDSGKYRRTRLFVLTLGCSRKCVRLLTFKSSSRIWAELHEKAFRRLGGSTRIVVLDNLREGVLSPDIYDPSLNPLYRDVLAHYGVAALPCKVRDPDRKGKVESGVNHAQMTPLKGKKFESLEEAQAYLDHWEDKWADKRIHGRTKRQVAGMFAEEKPFLQALPLEPFRYYQYGVRTVHLDGCVEVEAAYYGAPPGWVGRQVNVQWDAMFVRLLDPRSGELLREHLSGKRGGHRIRDEDRPQRTPPLLLQLLARAHKAGANIGAVCDAIHARQGELGTLAELRRCRMTHVASGQAQVDLDRDGRRTASTVTSQRGPNDFGPRLAERGTRADCHRPPAQNESYVRFAIALIRGKWKIGILSRLQDGPARLSQLRRMFPRASRKMLTQHLREMEKDGLIIRTDLSGRLRHVEYSLSDPQGLDVLRLLQMLVAWSTEYSKHCNESPADGISGCKAVLSESGAGQQRDRPVLPAGAGSGKLALAAR